MTLYPGFVYVSTGQYYGRLKVNGKVVRRSLKSDVLSVAKLRLLDYLKDTREEVELPECLTMKQALLLHEQLLATEVHLKPKTLEYYRGCVAKITESWPGIERLKLNEITADECRTWAKRLSGTISATFFNHTVRILRKIVEVGIDNHLNGGGKTFPNPVRAVKRIRVKHDEPVLPNREQFKNLAAEIEQGSGLKGTPVSELIHFLAFSVFVPQPSRNGGNIDAGLNAARREEVAKVVVSKPADSQFAASSIN